MAAASVEGGERRCQVLHLAQRCEDDLGGLSLPGCRERERGRAILLLLSDPALMLVQAHTRTHTLFQWLTQQQVKKSLPHLKTTQKAGGSTCSNQNTRPPYTN